jgi:hypothetical protein
VFEYDDDTEEFVSWAVDTLRIGDTSGFETLPSEAP